VQAYFGLSGGQIPIPLPSDPVYDGTSSCNASLIVTAPAASSISLAGANPTNAKSVSWTVTFNQSVSGVGPGNFTLGGSLAGAGGLEVLGQGTTYTVTANTGTGSGTLELDLSSPAGITDAVGGALSGPFDGTAYTIDRSPPTATVTFPATGGAYNAAGYKAGCSPTALDICGSVTDIGGVHSVKLSIFNGTKYWNGTGFTSSSETFVTAALALANATSTTWSYPLALPADGTYTIHLQTTDGFGNQSGIGYAATSAFTIDTIAPTLVFSGQKSTYNLLDQVSIACKADPGKGTALTTSPCAGFPINEPAWNFKPGTNTIPAPPVVATDKAGNSSPPTSVTFTVTVTASTLCQLTGQFVIGSPQYAALSAAQKKVVSALAASLCTSLNAIVPKLSPSAKAVFVAVYKAGVQSLATQGWLTSAQVTTLDAFAAAL
jgi:hypothetical protein